MDFGFQDVPGLLTPEMSGNVTNQMLLRAAAGLIKGGGPSPTQNFFGAFGDGITGALDGRTEGQTAAYKQLLQSEQIKKLAEERAQRERWAQIFGAGAPAAGAPAAPTPAAGMPPGVMSPPDATAAQPPQAPPQPQGMPQGVLSPPDAAPIAAVPPPAAPPVAAAPSRTPSAVRADASVNLSTVLANMPPAMRQMIGMMGPTKGMEALSTYVGKKFDKPSDSFLSVKDADGKITSHRADSPALDAAIAAGGTVVTTPSGAKENELVSMRGVDGVIRSYRKDDPAIDSILAAGGTHVTTQSSDPKTGKPSDTFLTVKAPDGTFKAFRADSPELDAALAALDAAAAAGG